jgi:hypothetical protein
MPIRPPPPTAANEVVIEAAHIPPLGWLGKSYTSSQNAHDIGDRFAIIFCMKQKTLTLPEIVLIAGTRVALGVGIGLLISHKLSKDQAQGAGWALLGVGVATSIPLALGVIGKPAVGEKQLALAS